MTFRRAGHLGLAVASFAALYPHSVRAEDEVISDPEIQTKRGEAAPPEHAILEPAAPIASRPEYPHDAIFRVTLGTRWGVDTQWRRPNQDVLEGTTIGVVEAEQRRSEALLLSVGFRVRHGVGMQRSGNTRSELDVAPVSAFADVTPAPGYHVRAGYQVITMGRFDVFSATNFLAVYDLRSGPVTMPEAAAVGQPALRFDFDKIQGFTLQAYYLPFFTPDLVSVYGSNYSLGDRDPSAVGTGTPLPVSRSALSTAGANGTRALAPAPDFTAPEGALRATLHGAAGELSASVGTALERLPAVDSNAPYVHYPRFGVASVDGATDLGPVQIGAEVAYMLHRTPGIEARPGESLESRPTLPPIEHANLAQGGLRAEIVDSSGWAAEVEAFATVALSVPSDPTLRWFNAENDRYWRGVAGGVHFAPPDAGLRFELAGAFVSGPTYAVMPRVEWEAIKTLFFEIGAVFIGGPAPAVALVPGGGGNTDAAPVTAWTGPLAIGGIYRDVDQVFTGVRWVP